MGLHTFHSDFYVKFCMENHQAYPQGVDVFLFTENSVMGLPRTAKSELNQ
ncbi:phosphonate C-P lyase system protein PhnH [Nodularia spumigena CS-584]|uniref:Phosphonate C-P lyase system protein PhnH n=1 Tax=Nodularia spumigena UHCC 0060 TaxID=3110300 RepID=A0ABU5UVZ2_NODSP|nr:phosphonate C-P lyase system protein PhnH [Nodularia spumigena]AHJ29838.1 PhnH protein [Nodularia spumigena CCY9414]MDB9383382.1 phosphonate C-P lyase system protein PhnH [Nodularia spumigena CS-584]MEA5527826.1 phosphonate C-P lyase system protein PhnH [Nodularia spumigena UHCC 0143]MEA5610463.1 phosphonate C-P lyase system protein PhnH [Nodularia spumigena UHCC 0060]MEA5613753.1 phosphonate C-P lyase system protein PhnH [Nodularia spumigena UHCC 0040]